MSKYETIIGLEIHCQLLTKSKMFCGCSTQFGAEPNANICPVCTGQPGVLPVINKKAVEFAIKTGLALNAKVAPFNRFARKHYFYPDLPKNFQTSQYELPIVVGGHLDIHLNGETKRIGITRLHLEEDAGKLVHQGATGITGATGSHVDYNRTGVPLMEIVTEPELRSPDEARAFLQELRNILLYLEVCDAKMEEGSMRCDANISLRPFGQKEFGPKVEMKNLNSFRAVWHALTFEVTRQAEVLDEGDKVVHQTRHFDDSSNTTIALRSKEEAHDYRYFPEPDLPPLEISKEWIEEIAKTLPELPAQKLERFIERYKLPAADAEVLVSDKFLASFYEEAANILIDDAKVISNWILGDVTAYLKNNNLELKDSKLAPLALVKMIELIKKGTISGKIAKEVLVKMMDTGKRAEEIVKESGLTQISDESEIVNIIKEVIKNNPGPVGEYKAGKTQTMGFLVGQIMKTSKGRANPGLVNQLLKKELEV